MPTEQIKSFERDLLEQMVNDFIALRNLQGKTTRQIVQEGGQWIATITWE